MIVLDATTKSLQVRLSAAGGAPEFSHQWDASYATFDQTTQELEAVASATGLINGATPVEMVAAPASGKYRKILFISVQNYGNSPSIAVEVLKDISATPTVLRRAKLQMFDTLVYSDGEGWRVMDGLGQIRSIFGVAAPKSVTFLADGADVVWTSMPAAVTFFGGANRHAKKLDLTNYVEARMVLNKMGVAGAAAAVVRARYSLTFDPTAANWLALGTGAIQVAVNVTNALQVSSWIPLAAGAKADVFVCLDGSGGSGVLSPAFGAINLQFR